MNPVLLNAQGPTPLPFETGRSASTRPGPADEAAPTGSAPATAANTDIANKDVFLKLLVAQLRNQDPLSPTDPIQFVSQLTQFSMVEQSMLMRQDIGSIRAALDRVLQETAASTESRSI